MPNPPRRSSQEGSVEEPRDEAELVRSCVLRCRSGDVEAFEPIVHRYMRRAAAFALAWTGNQQDALDLSQDAFARAFRAIGRFDPERPFYPWFHRILRHLCINHTDHIRRRRTVPLEDGTPWEAPSPLDEAVRAETRRRLWEALERLAEGDREILILREFQGLSYAALARDLGIPPGTVMSRLHHARRRLRRLLEDAQEGGPHGAV